MSGTGYYTAHEIDDDRGPLYWEIAGPDGKFLAQVGSVQEVYAWATERRVDVTLYTQAAWLREIEEEANRGMA